MILPFDNPASHPGPLREAAPLDLDLIRKYAIPGPRYTSYPPATRFHAGFGDDEVARSLVDDNLAGAGPLSLYFHLPFCESRCWYCGCHTIITRQKAAADRYLDDLEVELRLTAARVDPARRITQLHLGGGTPTFLTADQLGRLRDLVRAFFQFDPQAEISAEIDPRRLTADQVDALRSFGLNRASLGVQDTNPAVQLAIHRIQPQEMNAQAFAWLRTAGVGSINVDLIYGLPLQTPDSLDRTVDDVISLGPDRLSVFSYAHVPWIKPAQRIFEQRNQLPGPEQKLAMFALLHDRLKTEGFVDIGLDHFARPDDELARALAAGTLHRNFQGYSTHAGASLYGFGISSISQTADTYRQNHKSLLDYKASLTAGQLPVERGYRLTDDDRLRRAAIMRIMCNRRLDLAVLAEETGENARELLAESWKALEPLAADGLVRIDGDRLEVLPAGVPLLRVIAMKFDATLIAGPRRHALTV